MIAVELYYLSAEYQQVHMNQSAIHGKVHELMTYDLDRVHVGGVL